MNLAVAATLNGLKTLVLDLDPQQTAATWYEQRQNEAPPVVTIDPTVVVQTLPDALLRAAEQGFQLVVIDTPGREAFAVNAAMQVADLCLIVTRPTVADLRAQWATVETLKKFAGKRAAFVLNQCHHNGRRADTVRGGAMAAFPYPALTAYLSNRSEYQDAYGQAVGVVEGMPGTRAAEEVCALWCEVKRQLEKGSHA